MPFNKTTSYGESLNILESEVGLVTKTREATKDAAADVDGRKVIKAGSLWSKDAEIGVVLADYDMTDYEKRPIAVVFQGRLHADRVSSEASAKTADFKAQGLYLI